MAPFSFWVLGERKKAKQQQMECVLGMLYFLCSNYCTWKNKDEQHQPSSSMTGEALNIRLLPLVSQTHVWFGTAALLKCDLNSQDHMLPSDPQTNQNLKYAHVC